MPAIQTFAMFAASFQCVFALDLDHAITQYGHTAWTGEQGGLPGGVFALAQTTDGRLWLGTEFGLFQFDGESFSAPGFGAVKDLQNQTITALAASPDGALWIGARGSLFRWNGSGVQRYSMSENGRGDPIPAIHVDRQGSVWIGTANWGSGGLARIESDRARYYTSLDGFRGSGVLSVFEDHAGKLWIGCLNGLYRWDGASFRTYRMRPAPDVPAVTETDDGLVVAAGGEACLKLLSGDHFKDYTAGYRGAHFPVRTLLTDRNGGLWIGTHGEGLIHVHNGRSEHFTSHDGLSGNTVIALFEDREGNVWVGTERGLDRFRDLPVSRYSMQEGLSQDTATSVFASRSGGVWVATAKGLNFVQKNRITVYDRRAGLGSDSIGSLFEDRSGNLWADSLSGLTVRRSGRFRAVNLPGSAKIRRVAAATQDDKGVLWFSDFERGLISIRGGAVNDVLPWSIFKNRQATALVSDPKGNGVLLGFLQGGIARYCQGLPPKWYSAAEGLGSGAVNDFAIDPRGPIWIATEGGLSRLDGGRVSTLTAKNGLPCDQIDALVEDEDGGLWLNAPCGLEHLTRGNLDIWMANPAATIHPKSYGPSDGMRTRANARGYSRGGAMSSDGRIWFTVFDGVAVVDPKNLHENRVTPPVAIEAIRVNDRLQPLKANLRIGPNVKDLEIDYTAFSLVDPARNRFRYKLEGYEGTWHEAMGRRHALYSNVSPGHYTFRVIAANNDVVWNTTGATIGLAVEPAFYQTIWFALLCAASASGVLVVAYRLHLKRARAAIYARVQERMRERNRIGSELHDTLLQNIAGFALQLEGLSKIIKEPQSVQEDLRGLRREAEQWLRDAREFVWDLRLDSEEEQSLAKTLQQAGERLTHASDTRFETDVTGVEARVPTRSQIHLLRIVEEAIRNSVRHSGATDIQLKISYLADRAVRICITDNGCGFTLSPASLPPGHWGLTTMRERAQKLGAEFRMRTERGHGTDIEITVPLSGSVNGSKGYGE